VTGISPMPASWTRPKIAVTRRLKGYDLRSNAVTLYGDVRISKNSRTEGVVAHRRRRTPPSEADARQEKVVMTLLASVPS
jgi:hypothetical protein